MKKVAVFIRDLIFGATFVVLVLAAMAFLDGMDS